MVDYLPFRQILDITSVRQVLHRHHAISGMSYGIVDRDENVLFTIGWHEMCARFDRIDSACALHCCAGNSLICKRLCDSHDDILEYLCGNGMAGITVPLVIGGVCGATLFIGQFFNEDSQGDEQFPRRKAEQLDHGPRAYVNALDRAPVVSRECVRKYILLLGEGIKSLMVRGLGLRETEGHHHLCAFYEEQLRESERQLRTMVEKRLPGLMFTLQRAADGTMYMPYVSAGLDTFADAVQEEAVVDLEDIWIGIHPDDVVWVRQRILVSARNLTSCQLECRIRHPERGDMPAEFRAKAVRQADGSMLWTGMFFDLAGRKMLERNHLPEQRLILISELAGGLAHEVRDPLNAILSVTEALFREKEIAEKTDYKPYLQHIRSQIDRLSKLVNDLLNIGRHMKSAHNRAVSLSAFCEETLDILHIGTLVQNHRVELDYLLPSDEVHVLADAILLQQCFVRLIKNSVLCSPFGSVIVLRISRADENRVSLRVRDDGIGIAPDQLEWAFIPFCNMGKRGAGLDLFQVKHYIDSMGGTIRIWNNEPPPGCTVEFLLDIVNE